MVFGVSKTWVEIPKFLKLRFQRVRGIKTGVSLDLVFQDFPDWLLGWMPRRCAVVSEFQLCQQCSWGQGSMSSKNF